MLQLILHLIGDYVTQSDWMAQNKTKASIPAALHALVYSLPFLLICSLPAFAVICGTHFLIDRFRLARFVVWAKNHLNPQWGMHWEIVEHNAAQGDAQAAACIKARDALRWENCKVTGYPSESPAWLAVWLLIACDNTLHLAINYAALRFL